MARTTPRPRAPSRARLWLAGLLLASTASLDSGVAAAWADEANTITFEPGPGHSCAARPQPSSVTVALGTQVVFANGTASAATLQVDGRAQPGSIAPGARLALSLTDGQHQVTLALPCGDSKAATVIVSGASATPSTMAAAPETAPPAVGTSSARALPQRADGGDPPAAAVSPPAGASNSTSPSQVVPVGRSGDPPRSPVLAASPAGLDQPDDSKGLGLLAIVATICVLGVAAVIVRSVFRLSR